MANRKTKLGLYGIKSIGKTPFANWAPVASILILALTILYSGEASGGADGSARPGQTNSASFQMAIRDQMHADSELPQESAEAPKGSQWQSFLMSVEIAVCVLLILRLLLLRFAASPAERLN